MSKAHNIALVGNPNSGKSSLFNALTGLNQKVGNFPGVTVDKHTGTTKLPNGATINILDLPGTYSLYPRRADEWVSYEALLGTGNTVKPNLIVLIADASSLKRNLLFCSQILDLKLPVVMALTMTDIAAANGIKVNIPELERELGVPIVAINPRKGKGILQLKKTIQARLEANIPLQPQNFINLQELAPGQIAAVQSNIPGTSEYQALHYLMNPAQLLKDEELEHTNKVLDHEPVNATKIQAREILERYSRIRNIMNASVVEDDPVKKSLFTNKLDDILLHRFWGYFIMLAVFFLLFQSVFWLASFPMDAIDIFFGKISGVVADALPDNAFSDLLVNGILAGLGGIIIFIPQIMILFGLVTLLEDTGYMARISFLTDRLMRKFGLNGKSLMPMISGFACAVPAIMSARNIENQKERLLTILVTPLMSCSARLPVYTILISLAVPNNYLAGFISLQGLVMMALYMLGIVLALLAALFFKFFIRSKERSYFILELPVYRAPRWKNILTTMVEKARIFVVEAGKVIMIISIILWFLSSYGPAQKMQSVHERFEQIAQTQGPSEELENEKQAALIENSYAGILGKAIEPGIKPLGFDWKIGIALITSFAAREVFVGTMATLYSVGSDVDENSLSLRQKMQEAKFDDGRKVYSLPTSLSLLVFYVIAMQCMSTLAIVKRETKTWKWPIIQFIFLTLLAWVCSFITYQLFS